MFGIEYRWGKNNWKIYNWYKSATTRNTIMEILIERACDIGTHKYREINRTH